MELCGGQGHRRLGEIRMPPEPTCEEDEMKSASTYTDDEHADEYSDGHERRKAGPNPREEQQKATLEAAKGQLKILTTRFLASAGISLGPRVEESSETWLDVVTSLSWQAALLVKPYAAAGEDMDPRCYIKIKCVASGAPRQCEVIKGLVFNKKAAHKHMPTKLHNPRLLLLKGALGLSDVGLSSFDSMWQEKDRLRKFICRMMERCDPHVIMVEKSVSRGIQELLLRAGVTLVANMKPGRLERIARCTGSSIISFSEALNNTKLKKCGDFHIDKIIEEHNNIVEGGKEPSKTLLFLEGFPRPLGCTILLRGANIEELKKVKQVMHYTVFTAYRLILDTSFFEDQRAFLHDHKNASQEDGDEADEVLDSESILILMSSQCITRQASCEQSHLSRITYYGDFDVSLGRYLHDILHCLNLSCSSCGEPPEDHMHSYTHRNGNLTILVRHLLNQRLPGESEGKIWMWTRCLRCEHETGISKLSRRVLLSAEACNLSFGEFLELSFSNHSAARRLSVCGHLVNRDCLRFFGLGSKVALFRYSCVEIYSACKPLPTLEFHAPNRQDWFKGEERNVLARGATLFSEVASVLQHLKNQYPDSTTISYGAVKAFSQLEEILIKEKDDFEDSLSKASDQGGIPSSSVQELPNVNWLYQDLLLQLYVWDRRLHQLIECKPAEQDNAAISCKDPEVLVSSISWGINEINKETDERLRARHFEDNTARPPKDPPFVISNGLEGLRNGLVANPTTVKHEHSSVPQLGSSDWDDRERWIWNPFSESRLAYRKDLQIGYLEKFELINRYSPSHLSPLHEQSAEEVDSLQLCVSEDEISSIISCALAISEERRYLLDAIIENETGNTKEEHSKTMKKSNSFASESFFTSASRSPVGSSDSEVSFSSVGPMFSTEDLSGYDSSLLLSSLHPEINVNGKVALRGECSVICIYANQFYTLRKKCCPSELTYITSLSHCKKRDARGGKSKAFFAKTMDDRFIMKQIKKTEFESFKKFGPDYLKHVYSSLDTGSQTCLAKILGIYQVKHIRHGKEVKIDLMVMENLLFGRNISRIYDLKGTVFSRHVPDCGDLDTVYLDQNFVEDMCFSPIYIGGRTKHLLQQAIWNDTSFLASIHVMDYSLLVGVDKQKHELVFGIIHYLRQYTWDKQLETWLKTFLVVPKNVSPTIIPPCNTRKGLGSL